MTQLLIRLFVGEKADMADARVRTRVGLVASVTCIVCNVALCVAKGVVGLLAGSVSVVADAVNNLSDASSNVVSLLGFKLASRPADAEHPYGHGRYEYLAGLVVAVLVCAIGINLVLSSVDKIVHPEPTDFGPAVAVALVASMLVKLWMSAFNRRLGRAIASETLEATAIDSRNDVISSAAVLASAVVSQLTSFDLDGWAGLAVGGFICWSGIELVREAVSPLLGRVPDPAYVEHIRSRIDELPRRARHARPHGPRLRPRPTVRERARGDGGRGQRARAARSSRQHRAGLPHGRGARDDAALRPHRHQRPRGS